MLAPLEPYRVQVPGLDASRGGFFYVPEFISASEESLLLHKQIDTAPLPKWKELAHRRLQYWGGQLSEKSGRLFVERLPPFMVDYPALVQRLRDTGAFAHSAHSEPNHCLVNEYLPGQGIMPHNDGSAYFPAVATISLASAALLDVYAWNSEGDPQEYPADPTFSLYQGRRSLLVTLGDAYTKYLHGIAARREDAADDLACVANGAALDAAGGIVPRGRRVSLTFRDVERVLHGIRLGQ
ncbi:hypothetical protein MSPP1_001166 [Malassezia sp. CBS 17886]|nr:hypothetical protein MSPP1_001166 [Malassezia sp. CBS 17886]